MLRVAISFDYDSPAGYRESFNQRDFPPDSDYKGAALLLPVLAEHNVKVTFGVVGHAALPGEPPEHCQEQIRAIHAAGHEVASHSMTHRFIPPMRDAELLEEVTAGKRALEACLGVGVGVRGFIPPFNCPMHFPARGAFSVSEMLGRHGRGRGRQSVGSLLRTLHTAGYGWSRVSFENKFYQVGRRLRITGERPPRQPFVHAGVVAIPLHEDGFGEASRAVVRRWLKQDLILTLYAHPNQAAAANGQNARELNRLFAEFRQERDDGLVQFNTMGEVEMMVRRSCN